MGLRMLGIGLLMGFIITVMFSIARKESVEELALRLMFVELFQVIIWLPITVFF